MKTIRGWLGHIVRKFTWIDMHEDGALVRISSQIQKTISASENLPLLTINRHRASSSNALIPSSELEDLVAALTSMQRTIQTVHSGLQQSLTELRNEVSQLRQDISSGRV
jgi:hypothetical protein